jgi:hypothetical protein
VSAKTQIDKLQALLARIQKHATEPRVVMSMTVAPTAIATVPPSADARAAIEKEIRVPTPAPMAAPPAEPAESRSQLVVARPAVEPQEEVLELDERHIVAEEVAVNIEVEEEEAPPPSSRRPKPIEEMPEPEVAHPAPPESGRHIAAQELDFEDDLTGVREARREEPAPPPKEKEAESIPLQPVAQPEVRARHSMEMEIPMHGTPPAAPPTPAPPTPAASQVQVIHAEVPAADVAAFEGHSPELAPKSFGELLDAALSL